MKNLLAVRSPKLALKLLGDKKAERQGVKKGLTVKDFGGCMSCRSNRKNWWGSDSLGHPLHPVFSPCCLDACTNTVFW